LYYEQKKWFFCFEVFKANAYNALIFLTFFFIANYRFFLSTFILGPYFAIIIIVVACCAVASSFSSLPVAIVVIIVSCRAVDRRRRHRRRRPSPCRHHRLRINTGTTNFSLGIPISVWGYPNQNGDSRTEMGMRITKNPQTDSGISETKWGSIHPHTKTGIPESVWGLFSH
jgi:hypothetical protein